MAKHDPLAAPQQATPQSQPLPGRTAEQVQNAAGGYVFAKPLFSQLEDFLILGCTGGTYYLSEPEMVLLNVDVVYRAIQQDGQAVVTMLTAVATAQPARAPKPQPQLYALAAVFAQGDVPAKQEAARVFAQVVRTTDHLAQFWGYYKMLRGGKMRFGRCLKRALQSWFLAVPLETLAWRTLKGRQRKTPQGERLTVRDVLRLARPKTTDPARAAYFDYLCHGEEGETDDVAA
jgi:60 kDa SS-A/Ro ribonucleoprotein